jgi:hypothetical protein
MSLLRTNTDGKPTDDQDAHRVFPVTVKLTKQERKAITEFARSQGIARGQWIRDVILAQLRGTPANYTSLAEVLGIRLLLVNVLRPLAAGQRLTPETFDNLLDEISTAKHELAVTLASEQRR